ncbi:hypothetical protein NL676_027418 [Syzygium grande]|nr:hypothetical protein NL676_027418 [Syzygium grande]
MPAQSNISGGVCRPKDMKLVEEGLGGHDQLYESAVHHLLSGIDGIGELKRHYNLGTGEQASRLMEADDTAITLRNQVEELEAKVSMANILERRLIDMLAISEDRHDNRHDNAKRELALIQIIEKEKAEERACRASNEGETMSTPRPSPPTPRSTSPSFVPSPGPLSQKPGGVQGKRPFS